MTKCASHPPRDRPFCAGLTALALMLAALLFPVTAGAQSAVCLSLVNELAALDSRGGFALGGDSRYREYERAVREQKVQITRTQSSMRKRGCAQGGDAYCARLRSSLSEMSANLKDLERTLAQLSPGGAGESRRRKAILADIAAYGCEARVRPRQQPVSKEEQSSGVRTERRRTLLEQIFGVQTFRDDGTQGDYEMAPDTNLSSRYGTYRTLCVRSCDGYYFPISFSTRRDRFAEDEQACQNMCPGQEVSLYFHAMPSQDSEDMISYRDEQPYSALPNAFSYRKQVNSACSCGFARASGLTEIAGGQSLQVEEVQPRQPVLPIPAARPDPGLDPETFANSGGRFDLADIKAMIRRRQAPAESAATPGNRPVRIVGPEFFPVQ
jgi:Protein of unknown function (DUF2865)